MKRLSLFLVLFMFVPGCGALPYTRGIQQYELITTVGLDYIAGKYTVTVTGKRGEEVISLTNQADSISAAVSEMQTFTDRFIYLGHTSYCLIGETAAKENLRGFLDFFIRDPVMRYDSKVYIIEDAEAKTVIEDASDSDLFITDLLASIEKDAEILSLPEPVPIIDVINSLNSGSNAIIPSLQLIEQTRVNGQESGGQNDSAKLTVKPGGFAVIKEEKPIGYLTARQAKNVNVIIRKMYSDIWETDGSDEKTTSVKIFNVKPVITADWEDGILKKIKLKIDFSGSVIEAHSQEEREIIAAEQNELMIKHMENAVNISKEFGIDYLKIGDKLERKYRNKFKKIKEEWPSIYLDIPIEITSNITLVSYGKNN